MEMIQNLQQFFLPEVYLYFRMFRSCNISGPIPTYISNMTELQILQFPYHLSSSFSLLFIYLFSFCLFYWKRSELQPTYDWREHGQLSPYYLLQIHAYESFDLSKINVQFLLQYNLLSIYRSLQISIFDNTFIFQNLVRIIISINFFLFNLEQKLKLKWVLFETEMWYRKA